MTLLNESRKQERRNWTRVGPYSFRGARRLLSSLWLCIREISVHLWPKLSCFPAFLIDPVLGNMNDEPDDTDRSLASEKKIEQAIRSIGSTVKSAATDTETAHPDLATPVNVEQR
jgi:hypothetical protein